VKLIAKLGGYLDVLMTHAWSSVNVARLHSLTTDV
jgi:hypothetical protein